VAILEIDGDTAVERQLSRIVKLVKELDGLQQQHTVPAPPSRL
jgi:hypothetical protein